MRYKLLEMVLSNPSGGKQTKNTNCALHSTIKFLRCLLLMLTLALSVPVHAAFENIELMAGPAGMGSAYSAATQDTSALIWNPAGLARLPTPEIGISYLDLHGVIRL